MSNFFVTVQGILSNQSKRAILHAINRKEPDAGCILIFLDYSYFDISLQERFTYLINKNSGESYKIDASIKMVTQDLGLLFSQIPKGHKTICEICFDLSSLHRIESVIPKVNVWQTLSETYILSNIDYPAVLDLFDIL
jgi:hypothetical protein